MASNTTFPAEEIRPRSGLPLRWWPQIAALLLIVVEICWIVPWYRMVMQISYVAPVWQSVLVLGGVMLGGYSLAFTLEWLRLLRGVQLGILALMLFVSLVLCEQLLLHNPLGRVFGGLLNLDPGSVVLVFFVFWLWWRGIGLARAAIRPIVAWRRFELGLLCFMTFIFIAGRLGDDTTGLGWYMFFLFVGFLAVIFARVSYVGLVKGVRKNPFDRRWLASTTGILIGCITIAATLGGLLTGQYKMLLEWLVEGIRLLVAIVIFIAAIPGLLLSRLLGPIFLWLREWMAKRPTPNPFDASGAGNSYLPPGISAAPKPIPHEFQAFFFWGVVLLVLVIMVVRMRRQSEAAKPFIQEQPESLLKRGEARKLLRKAFQDALGDLAAYLRPARRAIIAARIRRIYAQLLDLCAELGYPRPVSKTPLEFLPDMGELFIALIPQLDLITQTYVHVRYGEVPETSGEVEAIEAAWMQISEEGRRLKRAGQGKLKTAEVKGAERPGV